MIREGYADKVDFMSWARWQEGLDHAHRSLSDLHARRCDAGGGGSVALGLRSIRAIAERVEAAISRDTTDHGLDLHEPATLKLLAQVRQLADHCPVLMMLQGTFSL